MSDDMLEAARQALKSAYAPYSRHRVGAAVRGASGAVYAGCNVENAAYPEGTCAEAAAIAAMVLAGETRLIEVMVMGETAGLCTPCGGCRQKLREFATADVPVRIAGPEGVRMTLSVDELLPDAFGPENLR
jgi:cytidine deaminase